jgi:hypothetical protein
VAEWKKVKRLPVRFPAGFRVFVLFRAFRTELNGKGTAEFKLLGIPGYPGETEEFLFPGIVIPIGVLPDNIQKIFFHAGFKFFGVSETAY